MRFNKTGRLVAAIAVTGAVAAGGAAFTAGNTMPNGTVAGYGTVSVTGGTVTSLQYALSADGTDISTATLVFSGDVHNDTAAIGFDGANSGATTQCAAGSYTSGTGTTFLCTLSGVQTSAETQAAVTLVGPST